MPKSRYMPRYIKSYKLGVGRRLLVLTAILAAAKDYGDHEIEEQANEAIAHDRKVRTQMTAWRHERRRTEGKRPEAMALDNVIDRAIGANYDHSDNIIQTSDADDADAAIAREYQATFFSEGLNAVTGIRYEEQLALVEEYVEAWRSPEWQPRLERLGFERFIARVESLIEPYRQAIQSPVTRELTWNELVAADNEGQDNMLAIVGRIAGTWGKRTEEHAARRAKYLSVFNFQNEVVGNYHRRRRPVPDVNPDTGEEILAEETAAEELAEV